MGITLDENTKFIISALENSGFEAFAVGGCVRDKLLGRNVDDYDITTSALPSETKSVFSSYNVVETGITHGTVAVILDGKPYEITTYRVESGYTDSRHPDSVSFVRDLTSDLARRDFTMNSIAFSPKKGIVDPFGGVSDLNNKVIRAVGNPLVRFSEDSLRILRALRFSATLGFEIEPETASAIKKLAPTVKNISPERIYVELKKLICGEYAESVMKKFKSELECIIPLETDVSRLSKLPPSVAMRFAYLCGNQWESCLTLLRADNATKNICRLLSDSKPIPKDEIELKKYVSSLGIDKVRLVGEYRKSIYNEDPENRIQHIIENCNCLLQKDLKVKGSDLAEIGFRGEKIGKILRELLNLVLEERCPNTKEQLLEYAEKFPK